MESLLAIKRLRISENPQKNSNPTLSGVRIGSEVWGRSPQPTKVHPGVGYELYGVPAEGTAESYSEIDADGNTVQKTESLILSWFSTAGDLDYVRTLFGNDQTLQRLSLPFLFEKLPGDRLVSLQVVLRDGRGGVDALARSLYLCNPALAAPSIASVDPPSGPPGTVVKLTGQGLDDLLDVKLGPGWLGDGRWDASRGAYLGTVPAGAPAGLQALMARGKGCALDPVSSFTVTSP